MTRTQLASLTLSAAALVGIALHEGYSDKAYTPVPGDVSTIGFGTTQGVKPGDSITPPKALQRALQDVQQFEGAIKRCVTAPLHQHEYDAYISLSYNIGQAAFCGSTLVRKANAGDMAGACAELSRWTLAGGKELPGLVRRRAAERAVCEGKS